MFMLAGAVAALALPPLHVLPAFLSFGLLPYWLVRAGCWRRAFAVLWLFAFGYFLAGLYWIGIAFFADAERFGLLAVPGVVGLSAILATITGATLFAGWLISGRSTFSIVLFIAALWPVTDELRGAWGTQFPWNPPALVWAFSDGAYQLIAWVGVPGLSFLTLIFSMSLAMSLGQALLSRKYLNISLILAITASLWGLGTMRLDRAQMAEDPKKQIRIVQAAISQHHKWDPEKRRSWFERHIELTKRAGTHDIVVWPESSVPYQLERDSGAASMIADALGPGTAILLGSDYLDFDADPPVLHNSVYALNKTGQITDRYDKVDLVPFGEFLPFRSVLSTIGLDALAVGSLDFSKGSGRRTIDVPGVPAFSPIVCFEAVFSNKGTDGTGQARWILNVTNDAWFGISSGPYQHMAMARMRAIEAGLPLVRAANTGISVVTDAYGRILERTELGEVTVLDAALPPPMLEQPWVAKFPLIAWLLPLLGGLLSLLKRKTEAQ